MVLGIIVDFTMKFDAILLCNATFPVSRRKLIENESILCGA